MFNRQILYSHQNIAFLLRKQILKIPTISIIHYQTKLVIGKTNRHTNRFTPNEKEPGIRISAGNSFKNHLDEYDFSNIKLNKQWKELKSDLLTNYRDANQQNINAIIVNYFTNKRMFEQGRNFAQYLRQDEEELNIGAMGKLLKFYYFLAKQSNLSKTEIDHILEIYNNLNSKYPALDIGTNSNLVSALAYTSKWEECVEILHKIKQLGLPIASVYSSIISAAFLNNKPDLGWNILEEMTIDKKTPLDEVYLSWFDYCLKNVNGADKLLPAIEKLIIYSADNNFKIGVPPAEKILQIFQDQLGWNGSIVSIHSNGKCPNCKGSLDSVEVSPEEYKVLRDEFYKKVIVGRNVFIKSSPKEVENFMTFLNKTSPYDMVVDGLNVSYSTGIRSVSKLSEHLVLVVKKLLGSHEKILVLGRKHMMKWHKPHIDFLKKNTYLFFTDDLSYDDPFCLYAALSSPDTYFMSRDLMRGHKFLLQDEKQKIIFKKWQQSHQYMVKNITRTGKVFIDEPFRWSMIAQKNAGWHIPINDSGFLLQPDSIEVPEKWLCLYPPSKPKRVYKKSSHEK